LNIGEKIEKGFSKKIDKERGERNIDDLKRHRDKRKAQSGDEDTEEREIHRRDRNTEKRGEKDTGERER
jgi:hypothetical protein